MTAAATQKVFDGHNDVLKYVPEFGSDFTRRFRDGDLPGHIDLPRAIEGGLGAAFFAIFVKPAPGTYPTDGSELVISDAGYEVRPAPALDPAYALQETMKMTAGLFRLEAESEGRVRIVRTVADLKNCLHEGALAAVLHFEGAEAIDLELNNLEVFYQAGLRSLEIVWSRPNAFGHGVPFRFPASPDTGPGLTEAGKRLVQACNRLGIMVDLSHLNARGFWDVAEISQSPLVVTHSAAHSICPSTRNLTDDQLAAIRDSGGVVGVNFEVCSIRPDGYDDADTPLSVLVAEIDYLVARLGIDGVAFGSDFDGATMPRDLDGVNGLPKLLDALKQRGYGDAELRKLAHENWVRVLAMTWND